MTEASSPATHRLRVRGEFACFSRPEMSAERVSYDVITPSAARGILEAIHWKPAIRWIVQRIHVLNEIRTEAIRRNEVTEKTGLQGMLTAAKRGELPSLFPEEHRAQRATILLRDVDYVIEARFEMTEKAGPEDNPGKHAEMFRRRARRGQCFKQPVLGCREFPARFELWEADLPESVHRGERPLGWMLHDIDFENGQQPRFFNAVMRDGAIEVPPFRAPGTVS